MVWIESNELILFAIEHTMHAIFAENFPPNLPQNRHKQPVLFVGHGSPSNIIGANIFRHTLECLGEYWGEGKAFKTPELILCISAHWCTHGSTLTAMQNPKTIHDFGGYSKEMFSQQYSAPGSPEWAAKLSARLKSAQSGEPLALDASEWGFDHGNWAVLKPLFPKALVPVIQLSLDVGANLAQHLELGLQLGALREQGVLIVASGNIVHNLGASVRQAGDFESHPWAKAFDTWVSEQVEARDLQALCMKGVSNEVLDLIRISHPSIDHYIPLLYAMGASSPEDKMSYFNDRFQWASVSMRSMLWH
jgi:4,5-DOPA dioxygenase extradiol